MQTNAEIISIGNELLSGLTINTNAAFIGDKLTTIGINVSRILTISDTPLTIVNALREIDNDTQIVIVTGGLGPTPDDLTKNAIADFFKTELILDDRTLQRIRQIFEGRGMTMPDINRDQAMIPAIANVIPNKYGTAPGLEINYDNKMYYFLPGVPYEMKMLIDEYLLDILSRKYQPAKPDIHVFRTNGLAESKLYEKVKNILDSIGNTYDIAFLPKTSGVDLRIKSRPGEKLDQSDLDKIREQISENIYSELYHTLPEIIGKLLIENKYSLAVGESFTGGTLSDWISNVPGCSQYFMGSVIAYSNESKNQFLHVPAQVIRRYGAVSSQTVEHMVRGIQRQFKTDCAIASTGIAGPGGGSKQKPVGLCYLAAARHEHLLVKKYNFGKDRRTNKERGAAAGLELLRRLFIE